MSLLATGVQHAHSRGVLHRDLKPSNVLLEPVEGTGNRSNLHPWPFTPVGQIGTVPITTHDDFPFVPKISDFGLAKVIGDGLETTRSNVVMGTASYMSPEQASGRMNEVTAAADIYALGAVLYELLTGRPPLVGESELETLQQVQVEEPVAPTRLRPGIPRDLETICLKCLDKEPRRRYLTAKHLADDLRRYLAGDSIRARPIGTCGKMWRWCQRNRAVAALLGCLVAALVLIAFGSTWMSFRLSRQTRRAVAAEQESKRRLLQSYRATAHATRMTQTSGRRFDSLAALQEAARLSRELHPDPSQMRALRDEAMACMALADMQIESNWNTRISGLVDRQVSFDADLDQAAFIDDQGEIVLQRCDDTKSVSDFTCRMVMPVGSRCLMTANFWRLTIPHGSPRSSSFWN